MSLSPVGARVPLREFSDTVARPFHRATPNQLTLFGLLLTAPMIWSFRAGSVKAGIACFLASSAMDFLDGALARYQGARMTSTEHAAQARRHFLARRGPSRAGMWFDPVVDKVRYFGALLPLGSHRLNHWMLFAALAFALILTFGRPALIWLARAAGRAYEGRANLFGKAKAWVEFAVIIALFLSAPSATVGTLFALATSCAGASIIRQIWTFQKIMAAS